MKHDLTKRSLTVLTVATALALSGAVQADQAVADQAAGYGTPGFADGPLAYGYGDRGRGYGRGHSGAGMEQYRDLSGGMSFGGRGSAQSQGFGRGFGHPYHGYGPHGRGMHPAHGMPPRPDFGAREFPGFEPPPWSREGPDGEMPEMSEEMKELMAEREERMKAMMAEREERMKAMMAEREAYMEEMEAMREARMKAMEAGREAFMAEMEKQREAMQTMMEERRQAMEASPAESAPE